MSIEREIEFTPISITPTDAEMLLSRRFAIEEICRVFGDPPIRAEPPASDRRVT